MVGRAQGGVPHTHVVHATYRDKREQQLERMYIKVSMKFANKETTPHSEVLPQKVHFSIAYVVNDRPRQVLARGYGFLLSPFPSATATFITQTAKRATAASFTVCLTCLTLHTELATLSRVSGENSFFSDDGNNTTRINNSCDKIFSSSRCRCYRDSSSSNN